MAHTTLFWFSEDLRLDDNPALVEAIQRTDQLLCVAPSPATTTRPNRYGLQSIGPHRRRFLQQCLDDLALRLETRGQRLLLCPQPLEHALDKLIAEHRVSRVVRTQAVGWDEQQLWQRLTARWPDVQWLEVPGRGLFDNLPFELEQLPDTFSKFRRRTQDWPDRARAVPVSVLPPPPPLPSYQAFNPEGDGPRGGEGAALLQLNRYFTGPQPQTYKETRNALLGWHNSTKLSLWLSHGCLSPVQVQQALQRHEQDQGQNESTQWIRFELLWREYFQWYALRHGAALFRKRGLKASAPPSSFYPERFAKWCQGQTPYPVINACMRQLNQTGYLSNRGRQWAASAFVHELGLDWRYGAAFFQQQLIDYDVGSNWGNWQYLAGVGADPRGWRHFDLDKQQAIYDPDGDFVARWAGQIAPPQLDSMDAADWPRSAAQ
ncbi:DASH family cryptochrome [Ferrimonas marina]|uniref:Cryptochrome DASH n=1 Tax=Ferrimonas marina TaxID=299255 RepID=A0A1M5MYA6_9GAMM|nr:DASH family cryptochrome [Ferrimonas marina]SHG82261.1 deoxyribodipyrimidine photo-lyase [Ferrimonas marina]